MNDPAEEKTTIGMVTIGQSPRSDVTADLKEILGPTVEIIECGALDELSWEEIQQLAPALGDDVLVSRLLDGTEVKLSHGKILDRMSHCIKNLEDQSKVIVILCTGEFSELSSRKLLITPSNLIASVVQNLLPKGRLGVLIPTPEQARQIKEKWTHEKVSLHIEALSPYEKQNLETVIEIIKRFQDAAVDMIVLDCMGFNTRLSGLIKKETGIPVILSKTLVARIVKEII